MSETAQLPPPEDVADDDGALGRDYLPVRKIPKALRNPKAHDLPRIRESIEQFGFTSPVLVDERTQRTVAGHGRLAVVTEMEQEGATRPRGILESEYGEWLIPVTRGWRSRNDAQAEAYLLADNRLTERGGWHERELAETVRDLVKADEELLHAAGYDDRDTRRLLALLNTVPPSAPDEFKPLQPDETFDHTCPRCQFGFND